MQWMIHELKTPLQVIEHAAVLICLPDLNLEGCLDVDRETQVVSGVSGSLSVTKDSRALLSSVSSGKSRALSFRSPMDIDEAVTGEISDAATFTLNRAGARATSTTLAKEIQPFPLKYVIDTAGHGIW
ncbi:hypothetical protein CVT26_000407 [Gymnopilus dilepis]|uniref:Uncharacterized protein n=1 Tax=Gymnopilus dilepis TaxID=231916 RepID=A0A409XDH6_9AGAR|nr:hypothetical protein CVT26_000407 [Gymnopilus dilepis]